MAVKNQRQDHEAKTKNIEIRGDFPEKLGVKKHEDKAEQEAHRNPGDLLTNHWPGIVRIIMTNSNVNSYNSD